MASLEVIYENGILRPLHPLILEEGTRLEVTMIKITPEVVNGGEQIDEEAYRAFLGELNRIAALPLQSPSQPNIAQEHDAILYPKQGKMP